MKYIKSCGFIGFRRVSDENQYLIIRSQNGDVGFPKGHTEPGESETDTATRELKEETGVEVKIVPGFRRQIEYPLPHMADCIKTSVYFLGECSSDKINLQEEEVAQASFLPYSEAINILTFDQTREILQEAETFLTKENRMEKIYNKLVRDKIPEIIEADCRKCETLVLSDEEYITALDKKLSEELAEYLESGGLEELADLTEVIRAVTVARGHTLAELEEVRMKKAEARGGFDNKIFLTRVIEK